MWKRNINTLINEYYQPLWYCQCDELNQESCKTCFNRVHGTLVSNIIQFLAVTRRVTKFIKQGNLLIMFTFEYF